MKRIMVHPKKYGEYLEKYKARKIKVFEHSAWSRNKRLPNTPIQHVIVDEFTDKVIGVERLDFDEIEAKRHDYYWDLQNLERANKEYDIFKNNLKASK